MSSIEIVHLSDLHWDSSKANDARIVVDALLRDLSATKANGTISPDILVFSGDLVNSGEDPSQFGSAYDALIKPALERLGLNEDRLFIVPGNHDISRKCVRDTKFIDNGLFQTLKSVDVLNRFIDDINAGVATNSVAVDRVKNYYDFVDTKVTGASISYPLLRTFKRRISDIDVGIACFDTAWRATGESDDVDRAKLLLGERNVDNAVADLSAQDIRLAVMHHPLEWLSDFDEVAVSSRISSNFDVVLCGHMHRPIPQTRTTAHGTSILSQTGSVYSSRRWFNGYQTIRLSLDDEECRFLVRSYYDTPRREFDAATNVLPSASSGEIKFPFSAQKKSSDAEIVERFLRHNRQRIRDNASDHLNMIGLERVAGSDVKEAFITPPLSVRVEEADDNEDAKTESYEDLSSDALLRSGESYVIAGHREVGKTSLLHYLAVLCAEGVSDAPRIPVYINVETLKSGEYELRKAITTYFGSLPKGFDLKTALTDGVFLFLADNYVAGGKGADALKQQIGATAKSRWICVSKPRQGSMTGEIEKPTDARPIRRVRVGALPRRSIRALSKQWSASIGSSDEDVFDAVMKQLKADGLPRTGYMVTLILWAMQQEKELDRVNEAILLGNVADYLLGKADFTQATHGRLDPRGKEITLEYLAEHLRERGSYVAVDDVVIFLSTLFRTKRLPFVATDVLMELVKCGILDRTEESISFKYKCFQEYFVALRLRSDSDLLAKALQPKSYQEYTRELEMLAGLRRQNADIIRKILSDLEDRAPDQIRSISADDLIRLTDVSFGLNISREQLSEIRRKRLTSDQVDDLLDAADRRATGSQTGDENKKSGEELLPSTSESRELVLTEDTPDTMNIVEFITASNLLAKVIKNSDFTDFDDKAPAARAFLLAHAKVCVLIKRELEEVLIDAKKGAKSDRALSDDDIKVLTYFITKLMTRMISDHVSSMLSSPNVGPMMEEIFSEKGRASIERMFIAFLLQTMRAHGWEQRWSELLREDGQSGFVVESVIEKMRAVVNSQYLEDKEHIKLHSVIDTAEEVLGWSNQQKDYMIADLRKAALQADLRDTV